MAEMITLSNGIDAYLATPVGEAKGAIIVIHEIWGLVPHTKDVADRFAAAGYLVLAPSLLAETGITSERAAEFERLLFDPDADPEEKNKQQTAFRALLAPIRSPEHAAKTAERVQVCFDFLTEKVGEKVAIAGFYFGGTSAFSLAVHEPRLKAAIPFYGHADFSVAELKNVKAPILAFYGETDEGLTTALPERSAKMKEADVEFEAVVYPSTGHAFFNDSNPWAFDQSASTDAWAKTLAFLAANI
ncbi:carboxymethylenebutenolidase [Renibacterium salmoninarum ATCC 33209]|uniref:Carboxymethylenebutenolidase n=1 Tax=Renibacterium salmoninarum (strain ATCC 33209 / DSM 20767 / JCM 11484 / NBRC 15589 / NCIMB 2235) TaxID=288705 RepID=A9WTQ7_RENSM|nr:dienelactone hydrolase family protein [Renibacterium salmoninarum]ABY24578.1 carboxymethylenebutenolidase [Renibacterium salmoninarum ATCC 33209]